MFNNLLSKIINRKNENPLTKQEQKLLEELRTFTLTQNAYHYYINHVKHNEIDTYEVATKKLIRNIILGHQGFINADRPHRKVSYFGNLTILYDTNTKEIVWLDNKRGHYEFEADQVKKEWLNKELGINTYKTEVIHSAGFEYSPVRE